MAAPLSKVKGRWACIEQKERRLIYLQTTHSEISRSTNTLAETSNPLPTSEQSSYPKQMLLLDLPIHALDTIIFFLTPPPNPSDKADPFARTPWNIDLRSFSMTCKSMRDEIWRRKLKVVRLKETDCAELEDEKETLLPRAKNKTLPVQEMLPVGVRQHIK